MMKRIFAHIGFSSAVTLLAVNLINVKYIPMMTAGLAVIFIASLVLSEYRRAVTVPLCLGTAIFSCIVFLCVFQSAVLPVQNICGENADVSFYITSLPEQSGSNYVYIVKTEEIDLDGAPQNIKLKLISDNPIPADAYQRIRANVTFKSVGADAYHSYGLWGKGIYAAAQLEYCRVSRNYIHSLMQSVLHLRRDIIETLTAAISGDAGALAAAVITGDKSRLSDETYTNFKLAGASHLMAVSGLHLAVVTGFVYFILKRLRVNRMSSAVIVLISVMFYAALAGFSKSIIRAGIMMAVVLIGELAERKGDALNSLGFATLIICLNPFAVSDISALLSILSVLSLLTLYPVFKVHIQNVKNTLEQSRLKVVSLSAGAVGFILSGFFTSLCVLLYTLPVMYAFFDYAPLAGLVSNIILIPLGSAATVVSIITYAADKIGNIAFFFNFITEKFNGLILKIVGFFASINGSTVVFGRYFGFVIAAVLMIFSICFLWNNKKLMKSAAVISSLLLVSALFINLYI